MIGQGWYVDGGYFGSGTIARGSGQVILPSCSASGRRGLAQPDSSTRAKPPVQPESLWAANDA